MSKVTIVRVNDTKEIHQAGCADLSRGVNRGRDQYTEDHDDLRSLVLDWYDDIIRENADTEHPYTYEQLAPEFRVMPCCDLPIN